MKTLAKSFLIVGITMASFITIAQALADKMKLSPEQIAKACKLGECK